jgi:hypothetical protein
MNISIGEISEHGCTLLICQNTGKILSFKTQKFTQNKLHQTEWLLQPSNNTFINAAQPENNFTVDFAFGADDCFPTVGKTLFHRDHGDIWGQKALWEKKSENFIKIRHKNFEKEVQILNSQQLKKTLLKNFENFPADQFFFHKPRAIYFKVYFPMFSNISSNGENKFFENLYASHALFNVQSENESSACSLAILEWRKQNIEVCSRSVFPKYEGNNKNALKTFFSPHELDSTKKPHTLGALWSRSSGSPSVLILTQPQTHLGIWWCNNGWGDGRHHQTVGIEPCNFPLETPKEIEQPQELLKKGSHSFVWIF